METPKSPWRKMPLGDRRTWLLAHLELSPEEGGFFRSQQKNLELADVLIENAVGYFEVPLGIVSGLVVNDRNYEVPLATEEPSVLAAAGYAARLLRRGIRAGAAEPVMRAQVFLEGVAKNWRERWESGSTEIEAAARQDLTSMEERGGGLRSLSAQPLKGIDVLAVFLDIDVRDSLGANRLNTLAESLSPLLEKILGGKKLLAILSNDAGARPAWAEFSLAVDVLAKSGFTGAEMAKRIVLAAEIAQVDSQRAVTHNKGIMNGITALALATGNDTRALEAAVHRGASLSGTYRGLSRYRVEGGHLIGRLDLPLALATVGGSVTFHPTAQLALKILGNPTSVELCTIAAALGLAQNFAALFALTGEGIQKGHMGLHEKRQKN